jgi:hypothetical protein
MSEMRLWERLTSSPALLLKEKGDILFLTLRVWKLKLKNKLVTDSEYDKTSNQQSAF